MLEIVKFFLFLEKSQFLLFSCEIGHGFLSGVLLRFSYYDALLYIFVLSNYFCKYNSKKIFEKVKITMQTSHVNVLYPSVLFFVTYSFCSFYDNTCVANISKFAR